MTKFYKNVEIIGSKICLREVVDGIHNDVRVPWEPTLYVKGKPKTETKSYKTLYGEDVYSIKPGSISECKDFVKKYENVGGFDIFGQLNYSLQYMHEYNSSGIDYKSLSAWSIDIETKIPRNAEGKTYFPIPKTAPASILLITMVDMHSGNAFTWGTEPCVTQETSYIHCPSEESLLTQFLNFWEQRRVDLVTGWNTEGFDLPYLHNRIKQILGDSAVNRLSPWGKVTYKDKEFNGRDEYDMSIYGVSCIDYMKLYKKYVSTPRESYSLGFISQEELGTTKLENPFDTFEQFYIKDFSLFVSYNIKDTQLVRMLDDKLNLMAIATTLSDLAHINLEDTFSPVKIWDALLANYCLDLDIVMPQQANEPAQILEGAYVKEPVPGRYKNVTSLDATSLYPSCVITNNISPETYIGNCGLGVEDFLRNADVDVEQKYVVTPTGAIYSKEKRGVLPELMSSLMSRRKAVKTEMLQLEQVYENTKDKALVSKIASLDSLQNAIKLTLNSGYGALSNRYFRFFKHDHASSITLTGQFVLRSIEKQIDAKINELFGLDGQKYLIYIDTDSLLFTVDPIIKKFGVKDEVLIKTIEQIAAKKITPIVNKICEECCEKMRSYENRLSFKLEVAADSAIFTGKKRYAIRVHSSEGVTYDKPKFKVKGLEMVRSSTPAFVRDKLKNSLDVIFDGTEKTVQEYIRKVEREFMQLSYDKVAFPRGANNIQDYSDKNTIYTKGVPIQVRGALLYNHYIKQLGIDDKYPAIGEGDKIRFIYLKKPNRLKENTIAWPVEGVLPPEFGIYDRIDYEEQFQKTFLAAIGVILEPLNWSPVERASLEFLMD